MLSPEEEPNDPLYTPESGSAEEESSPPETEDVPAVTPLNAPTGERAAPLATADQVDLEALREAADRVRSEVGRLVIGQHTFIDQLLATLLCGGHALVEGVPGIAKTLTARLLAKTVATGYSRIQFTPDLMPSDLTGTTVFNMAESSFSFNRGPLFSNIILIDEINRAPAKTQAALFEVMAEKQLTVDGETYPMDFPFFVLATQNPIEQEGTYRLPEAQLDRFMVRILIDYPSQREEGEILRRFRRDFSGRQEDQVKAVLTPDDLRTFRKQVEEVFIKDELLDYIAAIVHRTRTHADLYLGASPRASLAMLKMAKATAALAGRPYVTPDDIQYVAYPVLNHRIILTPEREMEGYSGQDVIKEIVKSIEVPR